MDILFSDLRFAARTLLRNRGFAITALLCLALGIGINTAVFSIVHGILFRDLPFTDADRLVALWGTNVPRGVDEGGITWADLQDIRASGAFSDVAGMVDRSFTLTGGEEPVRLQGSAITPNLFPMLGVAPQLGRHFRAEEGAAAGFEQVVLLSDALWRSRFGADRSLVGRTVHLNGRELTVVGVMPPQFKFPETDELWLPLGEQNATERTRRYITGIARLAPDIEVEAAQSQLNTLSREWSQLYPASHRDWTVQALSYRDSIVDAPARRLMILMLIAVGLVLLIACANVANLLLARASDREREIALRTALGASRRRVIRQLLTESLLLAAAGGLVGVIVSVWWVDAFVATIPEELAYWMQFSLDGEVMLYATIVSLATGVLFGLAPALQAAKSDLHTGLREGGRTAGESRTRARFRSTLVAGEIALSLMLLVSAALMVQSFLRLQVANPGFSPDPILSLRVTLSGDRFDGVDARARFFQTVAERLRALPGVQAAAATIAIPADDGGPTVNLVADGDTRSSSDATIATAITSSNGLFAALGIELTNGRDFTAEEITDTSRNVAIVGTQLAARLFTGQDPIGRRVRMGDSTWLTVIGVAPDVQYEEFGEETAAQRLQIHLPYALTPTRGMAYLVRGTGNPALLERSVRAALKSVDPGIAAYDVLTMNARRSFTTWPQRLFGKTFGSFGVAALILALSGVYGVMAYTVARRRREIGVRIALGAQPAHVVALVVGKATLLALAGVAAGLIGALFMARLLEGLLWGVTTTDPATFIAAPVLLGVCAILASYLPARKASRVDPMVALRND